LAAEIQADHAPASHYALRAFIITTLLTTLVGKITSSCGYTAQRSSQGGTPMPHLHARAWNDRRNAFEAQYAHEAQDAFLKRVHAARAAGRWAAEAMGLMADDAHAYAASVVDALVAHNTADPVFEKICADFDARGVTCTPTWVRQQLAIMPRA
jgi:hypothetical protein